MSTPPFRSVPPHDDAPRIPTGTRVGDRFTIVLPVTLVVGNRQALKSQIAEQLEEGAREVVIDMTDCWYVDSCGCGALVHVARLARGVGASLTLHALTDDVKTIFELTKLDTLFAVSP